MQVVGNDAMLLQLKCETCNAYIVLHASLQGTETLGVKMEEGDAFSNVSSTFQLGEKEVVQLREALKKSDGSFEAIFKEEETTENTTE